MPFGRRVGDKGSIRGRWRVKDDKVENQLMWTRDEGGYVPEKIRMVSIPERKLDCASSCGGFGVVDREGMGVMDLENPFSLDSETFDSVVKRESSRLIHGRSWTRKGGAIAMQGTDGSGAGEN